MSRYRTRSGSSQTIMNNQQSSEPKETSVVSDQRLIMCFSAPADVSGQDGNGVGEAKRYEMRLVAHLHRHRALLDRWNGGEATESLYRLLDEEDRIAQSLRSELRGMIASGRLSFQLPIAS